MDDRQFEYVVYVVSTPERLWQALTDCQLTQQFWFGCHVESDWRPGSKVEILTPGGQFASRGTVLAADAPRRLSYTLLRQDARLGQPLSGQRPSRVTFELEPLGSVVRLTLLHDEFAPGSPMLAIISQGWPKVLSGLKSLLETGSPLNSPTAPADEPPVASKTGEQASSLFVTYIATTPEKVWQALTDGDLTAQYFFGRRMQSDWKTGSPWKMTMSDGRTDSCGMVLESDPPGKLAISWRVEWLEEMRTLPEARVEFQIDRTGDAARLVVSEFHHPSIDAKYKEGGRHGWPMILSGLKSLLETGRPLPAFEFTTLPA